MTNKHSTNSSQFPSKLTGKTMYTTMMTVSNEQRQIHRHRRAGVVVTMVLMVCVLLAPVQAYAFHQSSQNTVALRILMANSSRPSSVSRIRVGHRQPQHLTTTKTQLRYTDFDDEDEQRRNTAGTAAGSTRQWQLREIRSSPTSSSLSSPPQSQITTDVASQRAAAVGQKTTMMTTTTKDIKPDEQETVDAYLEFLDRRYRRLHANEPAGPRVSIAPRTLTSSRPAAVPAAAPNQPKQKPERTLPESTGSTTRQSFPLLQWLLKGNPTPDKEFFFQQQQDDALFVLGVAGLASPKLLQKHHCKKARVGVSSVQLRAEAAAVAAFVEASASVDTNDYGAEDKREPAREGLSVLVTNASTTLLVKRVLVPLLRGMYFVERRKAAIKQAVLAPIQVAMTKLWSKVHINVRPRSIMRWLLEVGGGRQTIMITLAAAYASVVLARPIIQTIVTEATY